MRVKNRKTGRQTDSMTFLWQRAKNNNDRRTHGKQNRQEWADGKQQQLQTVEILSFIGTTKKNKE